MAKVFWASLGEPREADIRDEILEYLRKIGAFAWEDRQLPRLVRKGVRRDQRGIPDILAVWRGHPIAIEVKKPGGRPSQEQLDFMSGFIRAGGVAFIARSVQEVIEELGRRIP